MNIKLFRITAIVLLLFLLVSALYFAKPFLVPFCLAVILSMVFLPVNRWLEKHKLNRALAAIICILILLGIFSIITGLVSWQVRQIMQDKDQIQQQLTVQIDKLQETLENTFGVPYEKQKQVIKQSTATAGQGLTVVSAVMGVFVDAILVLVYIFSLMYFRKHLKRSLLKMIPETDRMKAEHVMGETTEVAQHYLYGLGIMIVCLWIMYSIGFSIVGVKHAIFFAILCGLLEVIPFVGNITGTIITVLMVVAQGGGTNMIIGIIIVYALVQFIQTYIFEPWVVGSKVNVNALSTIVALVVGELVWGVAGIVLAIPFVGILKAFCDNVESLKPVGVLLGKEEKQHKQMLQKG